MKSRNTWQVKTSNLAKNTFNPIRSIIETMDLRPNPEKPMIALSIGDPTVFGNLKPAAEITDALVESVRSMKYNGYAPSTGYEEARDAVAKYVSVPGAEVQAKDVVLCSGCSCSLDLCISVLANPGQNILIPRPGFSLYRTLAEGLGIETKPYNLKPDRGWEVDLVNLESQIDANTVAIVINNPSNPCGSVFSKEHLEQILAVAARHYVPIIADEIYDYFVFEGKEFHPIASLSSTVPVLSCGGLTKRYLIPGWRMGWIVIHDRNDVLTPEVRRGLQSLSQRIIGSSTIIQGALPKILTETPRDFFENTLRVVQTNAQTAYNQLTLIPGLKPIMPSGAMYMMVGLQMERFPDFATDLEFVERLVTEQSVFCLPGKCFDYPDYVRLVLTVPEEQVAEACKRIADFCSKYYCVPMECEMTDSTSPPPTMLTLTNGPYCDFPSTIMAPVPVKIAEETREPIQPIG